MLMKRIFTLLGLLAVGASAWATGPADLSEQEDGEGTIKLPNTVILGIGQDTDTDYLDLTRRNSGPAADGADLLRDIPGLAIGRFGGRGLEPVIRGQSQNRINVLIDGSYVHGGCPNRMDPPASFASVNGFDRVVILKGVQTLRYGGGGSGGTVLFEREAEPGKDGFSGSVNLSGSDNDLNHDAAVSARYSNGAYYLVAEAEDRASDNYVDGDGNEVRSAYAEDSRHLLLGLRLPAEARLELGYELTSAQDALYAGAGMDSPFDEVKNYRLKYQRPNWGPLADLSAELYAADVEHVMDNFSNRPLTAPMAMRVPSESDTHGGRLLLEFHAVDTAAGPLAWTLGLDSQQNQRNAVRLMGPDPSSVQRVNSYMWPDARLDQHGIFAESTLSLSETTDLRMGLRYDRVKALARAADADPPGAPLRSPNQLYLAYYGTDHQAPVREDNWGGLLRLERRMGAGWTLFAGASQTLRTADASERFLAANNPNPAARWIGNPGLQPEQHRQIDLGGQFIGDAHRLDLVVFADWVDDYILRDRAHGQDGIALDDGASIYRNVEARLVGAEVDWAHAVTPDLELTASMAYVRSRNVSDGRDIAQTPPLSGHLGLSYELANWSMGATLRWADRQNRVDEDPAVGSGLDARKTPGYGVVNLYAHRNVGSLGVVRLGVDNLFDRTYANHLNRANLDPFNPDPVQVNEPGRTLWMRYQMTF